MELPELLKSYNLSVPQVHDSCSFISHGEIDLELRKISFSSREAFFVCFLPTILTRLFSCTGASKSILI